MFKVAVCDLKREAENFTFDHVDAIYISNSFRWVIAVGHTKPNAPDPIRTPKLNGLRQG